MGRRLITKQASRDQLLGVIAVCGRHVLEQAFRPRAGRVQHHARANVEAVARQHVAGGNAVDALVLDQEAFRLDVVGHLRAELLGGHDERQHQARRIVHLAVFERGRAVSPSSGMVGNIASVSFATEKARARTRRLGSVICRLRSALRRS